jgi:molecular chaperone Hsp33
VTAEAIQVGEVRGFVVQGDPHDTEPVVDPSFGTTGFFRVRKILYNHHHPISSIVELKHGDGTSEFQQFLDKSEQIPSHISLVTKVDNDGKITFCGGILVQNAPEVALENLEKTKEVLHKHSIAQLFLEDKMALKDILPIVIPEEINNPTTRTVVDYFCRCKIGSIKSKMATLGIEELKDMQQCKHNDIKCVYCAREYHITDADFEDVFKLCEDLNKQQEK